MTDRTNTFLGWLLFAGIVALGLSSISSHYFRADKHHEMEEWGYPIAGGEAEGEGGDGPTLAALLAAADPAAGERVFAKCVSCHTIDQGGANGIGPNLYAVVGDPIGHGRGGFAFSSVLAEHGGNWDFENLDAWLKSPRAFAPGTKMSFAGLSNPEDRANLIAYLNTMGSNLPLPTVEEAPADDAAAEAGTPPEETEVGPEAVEGAVADNPVPQEPGEQ